MSKTRADRLGFEPTPYSLPIERTAHYHKSTDTDTYMIVYCAGVTGCA